MPTKMPTFLADANRLRWTPADHSVLETRDFQGFLHRIAPTRTECWCPGEDRYKLYNALKYNGIACAHGAKCQQKRQHHAGGAPFTSPPVRALGVRQHAAPAQLESALWARAPRGRRRKRLRVKSIINCTDTIQITLL